MLNLPINNRFTHILSIAFLLVLILSSLLHISFMWQNATVYSKDASVSTGVFVDASRWLSSNLGAEEMVIVPMPAIFSVINPDLTSKLVSYHSIWDSAGVILQASTTDSEVLQVRNYLIDFLKENPQVKYVVRDWVGGYSKPLYEANVDDELMILIREAKVIPFTSSDGWSNKITIYERVQYAALASMDFSVPQNQSFTSPQDVLIQYDSDGAVIHKADSRVGYYLPLEEEINASKQNYLAMQIKPDIENFELTLAFYFDVNRDGRWSGYDIDYVKSATFIQTKLGWMTGEWNTIYQVIPQADDPVVQMGIILMGDKNGTVTLRNLSAYTEITFEN